MDKTYSISNDGTIFEIKDDGSIAKLAKIDEQGQIKNLSGTIMTADGGSKGGYWFFIVLLAIVAVVLGILYTETDINYSTVNRELNKYRNKYENESSSLRSEINSLKQELNNAKANLSNLKSKVSNTYPLIITDIEIANINYDGDIQTNYGYSLYSSSTMYLKPRISYIGLTSGTKTLKVKWYNSDGTIRRGSGSPSGISFSDDIYISEGSNNSLTLSGWGNENKGNWRSGTYRIEIWYENICLKSKTFTVY